MLMFNQLSTGKGKGLMILGLGYNPEGEKEQATSGCLSFGPN